MKSKLIILSSTALAVGFSAWLGGATIHTRWLNEETAARAQWKWEEHCREFGKWSNHVIFPYYFDTNVVVAIGTGTNSQNVEFGFRDDGIVVWRKR